MEAMTLERAAAAWAQKSHLPKPHRATILRWARKGVRGTRLQAERRGGRWFVTPDALAEFHRILNTDNNSTTPQAASESRAEEIKAAHAKLDSKIGRRRVAAT